MARRVSFSPNVHGMPPPPPPPLYFTKHGGDKPRIWTFRPPKKSAMRLIGRIKTKFTRALDFVLSSSSSSCNCTLKRSTSYVEAFDSHRAQAVEDCIQFLNSSSSSSSFQRSKSLSSFSY
ncbi:hypothetical protein L1987_21645 [Smallanthus sonchifolius]|uniref:Uncharacterized protein n=1 Tax=Smallanthus sonchifolius TaxID=185202 RepID=A0ACB9IEE6_9ASTR|nr:hypothetical protein L1987_21645 [Smallanthus sonchifolius]